MIRAFFVAATLILVAVMVGRGQDVQLSPEPASYLLAAELRIQSAATIGATTLVVWGTAVAKQQAAGVQGVLRFQLLRDTVPIGLQRTLHNAEAMPYQVVRVLDLLDRYLVVWNDRRESDRGIYAQIVDTAGNLVSGEVKLGDGAIQADSLLWRLRSATGWVVVWQESSAGGSLQEIRLDEQGNVTGKPTMLAAGAFCQGQQFSAMPNLLLLKDQSGSVSAFWSDSGTAPHQLPSDNFKGSYYLDAEGSLLVLKDSTLSFYNSFADTIPTKNLRLSFGPNLLRGTQTVMKDDTGGISVFYMRERIQQIDVFYTSHIYRQVIQGDTLGKKDTIAVLKFLDYTNGGLSGYRTKFDMASISQGFNNTTLVTVRFIEEEIQNYMPYRRLPKFVTFAHSNVFIGPFQNSALPNSLRRLGINGPPTERRKFDTVSSVSLMISGGEHTVTATIAGDAINTPQEFPNVMEREGKLLVTYKQPEDKARYTIGVWNTATPSALRMLRPLDIPVYDNFPSAAENYRSEVRVLNGMNNTILQNFIYQRKETQTHGQPTTISYQGEDRYYVATDTGWCLSIKFAHAAFEMVGIRTDRLSMHGLGFQFEPEQKYIYGCEVLGSDPPVPVDSGRFTYAMDSKGEVKWNIPDAPKNLRYGSYDSMNAIIPIAEKEFLAVYPASQQRLNDTAVIAQSFLPPLKREMDYQRYLGLRNKRYLRYYSTQSAPNTLWLDIFSHSGKLLDSTSLQFNIPASKIAIAQNPTDRSLALLYGGVGGAKLTLLSEQLRVQQDMDAGNVLLQNYPVSATRDTVGLVAGMFRNDTLFVVWEDFRNGKPDIYSTGWQVPKNMVAPILPPPPVVISTGQPIAIIAAAPIPCNDQIIIQHQLAESGVVVFDVLDELGKNVKQITKKLPQGLSESQLTTHDLFPGIYVLRISSQHGEAVTRFLVVR